METTIRFKAKVQQDVQHFVAGELVTGTAVKVPSIGRQHFVDPRDTLAKIGQKFVQGSVSRRFGGWVFLDREYEGVAVSVKGMFAEVTITVSR